MADVPQIFDARLRRQRRLRAAPSFAGHDFLAAAAAGEIGERLTLEPGDFAVAMFCGAVAPPAVRNIVWKRGDTADAGVGHAVFCEEFLPFRAASLDVYASVFSLHAVNDLPGALTQIRRSLKPGGMFIAAMLGGETLRELRGAFAEAEIEIDGGLSPRVAPFVDVRDAGALLQRAGFARPVADVDTLAVHYEHPLKLLADLRGMGETNVLQERRRTFLKRRVLLRACEHYRARHAGEDGRVKATFDVLYLTGFAPA